MDIEEAKKMLDPIARRFDHESFHSKFDQCLEARLDDLDPEFMRQMREYYEASGMARWCG
jgi:hypothetical protein